MSIQRGKCKYIDIPASFDTETTSTYNSKGEKIAFMYAWMLDIDGEYTLGRTWMEFAEKYLEVIKKYDVSLKNRLVIYVHNLAFEFQFMRKLFEWKQVFSLNERKVVYAVTLQGVEFRCSYVLTNKSLKLLAEDIGMEKLVGDLDYDLVRHSETQLTEKELGYCREDVNILTNFINRQLKKEGGMSKIPLTATGYVRRDVKKKCFENKKYRRKIKDLTLKVDEYKMLKRAFMGGYTHCNPKHMGKTLLNVISFDFTSAYPAVILSERFPMSSGFEVTINSIEELIRAIKLYCCVFEITFENIERKDGIPDDYLSVSKCTGEMIQENNGRVNSAKSLSTIITDVDFRIITSVYRWSNIKIGKMYCYTRGYLPKEIIESVLRYYKLKTELKGIEEKEEEYNINKGFLNSIYGMMVTDPLRDEILYERDEWDSRSVNIEEGIEAYNKSSGRFLHYPWGIWITAYNRLNLWRGIIECDDDYVYSDTDSIKMLNADKHIDFIERYNKEIILKVEKLLNEYGINKEEIEPKDKDGKKHPIGVWDFDGEYKKFKTLGAKRYMVLKYNKKKGKDELSFTISGVNKEKGIPWLFKKYGTVDSIFEHFEENLEFPEEATGKLTHSYIDEEILETVTDYLGNVSEVNEFSGCHLSPASYSLSISEKYKAFIKNTILLKGGE